MTDKKKKVPVDTQETLDDSVQAVQAETANQEMITRLQDDLERALKNRPREGEGAVWSNGIELVYRKLQNMLENEGVIPIQAEGAIFDPNFHEAIVSEQSDMHESGQVIEVVQQGYMLGEKVLRPAMVRVAR